MPPPKRPTRVPAWIGGIALAVLLLAAWAWTSADADQRRAYHLSVSGGQDEGLRHAFAERLAREAGPRRLTLAVKPTRGSEEALDRVNRGTLDLAFVQGALSAADFPNVRQVAALHIEPLHLLVKAELFDAVRQNLGALRGRVVNLSQTGSGTHVLARAVLAFAGLASSGAGQPGDYRIQSRSYDDLLRETDPRELPDAAFMVSSLPSPIARHLVRRWGYQVAPLPFGDAFAIDGLAPSGNAGPPVADTRRIETSHVASTVIPAYTYDVEPPVPAEPTVVLGARLLLVARAGVPRDAVDRLVEVVYQTGFVQIVQPPLRPELLDIPPEFPWHPGTLDYLARHRPLIASDLFDWLDKSFNIAAILLTGVVSIGLWMRRKWRSAREATFSYYIAKVNRIEAAAAELESAERLEAGRLVLLQRELSEQKRKALERFEHGELEGDEALMSSFLAQVGDVRNYLTRLLLHERDNIEEQARLQGRSFSELWRQATRSATPEPPS